MQGLDEKTRVTALVSEVLLEWGNSSSAVAEREASGSDVAFAEEDLGHLLSLILGKLEEREPWFDLTAPDHGLLLSECLLQFCEDAKAQLAAEAPN